MVLIVVFSISIAFAQEKTTRFDSAFNYIIFEVINKDVPKAKHLADSLLKQAPKGRERIKALMLLANIATQENALDDAMVYALRAEGIAKKEKDYEWQVRAAGFLSAIFKDANLIVKAKEHLRVLELANRHLKESGNYDLIQINIHHEKAYLDWNDGHFKGAIQELQYAQKYIPLLDKKLQGGFLSKNYLNLGESYLGLKDYGKAAEYFHLALDAEVENKDLNDAAIYRGLGDIELHHQRYEQALQYLMKAQDNLAVNQHFSLSGPVYKSLSNYYKQVDLPREALHYDSLYLKEVERRAGFTEKLSNRQVQEHLAEQRIVKKRNALLYLVSGLLIVLVLLLILRLSGMKKKEKQRYAAFIQKMNATSPSLSVKRTAEGKKATEGSIMPIETEERLLQELRKLEDKRFFLQKEISLSSLAAQLNSNPKYVSYLINEHKGKDFSNYINELRVVYVIEKFQNDPEFLKYKLAFIANLCGFSSHSKFTAVFKNVTGLSPSAFIALMKEESSEAR